MEQIYSQGLYPVLAGLLARVNRLVPFSLGDTVLPLLVLGSLVYRWLRRRSLRSDPATSPGIHRSRSAAMALGLFWVIFLFYGTWGFNYFRRGAETCTGIAPRTYTSGQLKSLNEFLVVQLIHWDSLRGPIPDWDVISRTATESYQRAAARYPTLSGAEVRVKPSSWSWMMNFWGVSGYFNPFTGEAQVNRDLPAFQKPFTASHEMAHQRGFAREDEASFAGYLAAQYSDSAWLRYSALMDMFLYAQAAWQVVDSAGASQLRTRLPPRARQDLAEWVRYLRRYDTPVKQAVGRCYDLYLKGNRQEEGLDAYSRVLAFVLAYHREKGDL